MSKMYKKLSELKRGSVKPEDLTKGLLSENADESARAGKQLARDADAYGLNLRDYLTLAVEPEGTSKVSLNGYERTLMQLNLPVRNDFERGIVLQAASDQFQTYPGTRALFPEVIDDVVRFATRQDQFERAEPLLAGSRIMSGNELVSTVIDDDADDRKTHSVAELGRIPIRTVRTSETAVRIYKHGSGIRTSYEFERRSSLDLLVPFMSRITRELEISKTRSATSLLLNGDGQNGAAPVVSQATLASAKGITTATNGKIDWHTLLAFLVDRAKAGVPVDTMAMNWDSYFQWLSLFAAPSISETDKAFGPRPMENMAAAGVSSTRLDLLANLNPVLSSTVPEGQILAFSRGDTLEELVESGSNIQETERAIENQSITVVKTENTGYRLVYGDTRAVYQYKTS